MVRVAKCNTQARTQVSVGRQSSLPELLLLELVNIQSSRPMLREILNLVKIRPATAVVVTTEHEMVVT